MSSPMDPARLASLRANVDDAALGPRFLDYVFELLESNDHHERRSVKAVANLKMLHAAHAIGLRGVLDDAMAERAKLIAEFEAAFAKLRADRASSGLRDLLDSAEAERNEYSAKLVKLMGQDAFDEWRDEIPF